MIISVCLNPTIQRTLQFKNLCLGNVNRAFSTNVCASGKGINVCRVLSQLDVPAIHITQVGGRFGDWFLSMATDDGITVHAVTTAAEIRTCTTIIAGADSQKVVTELVEEGCTVEPELSDTTLRTFCAEIDRATAQTTEKQQNVVVISGSKAPGFASSLFPDMTAYALHAGWLVVADYRGLDLTATLEHCSHSGGALIIKPNEEEFTATFNRGVVALSDVCRQYDCSAVITRGSNSVLAYHCGHCYDIPVEPLQTVCNTTGCGDSFTAGFAAALAKQGSFEEAVNLGIDCGRKNAATLLPGFLS